MYTRILFVWWKYDNNKNKFIDEEFCVTSLIIMNDF